LVDSVTGVQLWADTYDRELAGANFFEIQDDITDRVVATVADREGVLVRSMSVPIRARPPETLSVSEWVLHYYSGFAQRLDPAEPRWNALDWKMPSSKSPVMPRGGPRLACYIVRKFR
jgi:hypothetical protein